MSRTPAYQESVYTVHQRYEDISQIIFHQLQKSRTIESKKKSKQAHAGGAFVTEFHSNAVDNTSTSPKKQEGVSRLAEGQVKTKVCAVI